MAQYQKNDSWCAAAAVQNALACHGVRLGQSRLARIIGCTHGGADEDDILQALHRLGCSVDIFESNRKRDAETWLKERAFDGPLLLCVQNWCHWVSVAGGVTKRLWLFDPDPEPWNKAENGSWPLLPKTVLKRWKAARRRRREGGLYYGIAILAVDPKQAKCCTQGTANDGDGRDAPILTGEGKPEGDPAEALEEHREQSEHDSVAALTGVLPQHTEEVGRNRKHEERE